MRGDRVFRRRLNSRISFESRHKVSSHRLHDSSPGVFPSRSRQIVRPALDNRKGIFKIILNHRIGELRFRLFEGWYEGRVRVNCQGNDGGFCHGPVPLMICVANQILVNVIRNANHEPYRTVTEAAIIALTVHSNTTLVPSLKQAEAQLTDPVIQDDLENALSISQSRAHYLATSTGKDAGGSIVQAVRAYFMPALEGDSGIEPASEHTITSHSKPQVHSTPRPAPQANVEIERLVFSPDKNRALAHVVFKEPGAIAHYKIVLQKRYGDWTLASVWLGREEERPGLSGTP